MKMRKLVAVLMAVMMLCCIVPFSAMAAGNSAKIDFSDKANRTDYSSTQQVWKQNGITVTNDKGASTTNVGDYANPGRFYKGSTVTIEYPGMTAIVIKGDFANNKDYFTPWSNSFSADAEVAVDDAAYIVTITLANAVDSFTWEQLSAQARAYSITVYTNGATPEEPEEPEEPETPDAPTLEVVTEPDVDIAYKFGMVQGNVSATDVYYLIGGMNGYYMATGTDVAAAIDVYLENAEGGYYMYTIVDGAKTYINMVVSGTHVNGAYEAAASTVYTFDATAGTVIAEVDGAPYWFGTRNDKTYTTVGPCKTEYAGFYCQFYTEPEVEPEVPVENKLTIAEAIALGAAQADSAYTEEKYYVTGVISEVYNVMYGNMKLADDEGNVLTIYGTWSADGETRYDALEVKPVAGDTVTIYGPVGNFKGAPQIKNGWIVDHIPGEGGEEPEEPSIKVEVAETLEEGVAYKLGLEQAALGSNYYFTGVMSGYYGATDTDFAKGVDMYVEIVEDGYKMYFNDESGAKQYIALVQSGTHYNFTFGADASVFSLDAERNALYTQAGDQICYIGTYGSYYTMSTLKLEMLSDTDYIARLYVEAEETPVDPGEGEEPGENEDPGEGEEPGNTEKPGDDEENDSPDTGDNTTVFAALAVIMMALAAAVAVLTSKKRA